MPIIHCIQCNQTVNGPRPVTPGNVCSSCLPAWHRGREAKVTELERQIQAKEQRIIALEANKQDLVQQLSQAKQKHQNHLSQEKAQLTKEIQLIKGVIQ